MKSLAILSLLVLSPSLAQAQTDWRQRPEGDIVEVRDGKWVIEEFSQERFAVEGYEPSEFQLRLYAEVPAGSVMSRDVFVRITYETQAAMLLSVLAEAYQVTPAQFLAGHESRLLQAAIGQPDVELNLYMTAEGLQIEWKDNTTGQSSRQTMIWSEVLGG